MPNWIETLRTEIAKITKRIEWLCRTQAQKDRLSDRRSLLVMALDAAVDGDVRTACEWLSMAR